MRAEGLFAPPRVQEPGQRLGAEVLSVEPILLLVVATVGLVAGRLVGLPSVVAYLVAGVVAGPGGLGLVQRTSAVEHWLEEPGHDHMDGLLALDAAR